MNQRTEIKAKYTESKQVCIRIVYHSKCVLYVKALGDMLKYSKEQFLPATFKGYGWSPYLLCPPVDDPRNLLDIALNTSWYEVCSADCLHELTVGKALLYGHPAEAHWGAPIWTSSDHVQHKVKEMMKDRYIKLQGPSSGSNRADCGLWWCGYK